MSDFFDDLSRFKDQALYLFHNPNYIKMELMNDHQLLVEVIGIILLACLILLALLKPTPTLEETQPKSTDVRKKSAAPAPTSPKRARPEPKNTTPRNKEEQKSWIKRNPPSIHELSVEEEQALNEAIAIAGKQALAEMTGAPHQAEFFPNNEAHEAAKKMFARQKNEAGAESNAPVSKQEFLILYFMAPRSHAFENEPLFQLLRKLGLQLNDHRVFEYCEGEAVQFYVSSALKPGHFDLHSLNASVPGVSFVLDLQNVQDGQAAFNAMLMILHQVSENLRGDILDEYRQRLTQSSISAYMARIKSFSHLKSDKDKQ